MKKPPLIFPLFLAVVAFFINAHFFQGLHLLTFVPFLMICYIRKPLITSLYISFFIGLLLDLVSYDTPFGINSLCYPVIGLILHTQRSHFFDDKSFSLGLYTAIFSLLASIIEPLLLSMFENKQSLSWNMIFQNMFIMPFFDAVYAIIFFSLPIKAYSFINKFIRHRSLEE